MKVWPGCLILSGFQASSFTVEHCALDTAPLKSSVSLVLQILPITPRSSFSFYVNDSIPCVCVRAHTYEHARTHTHAKVRGLLAGIGSLFTPCESLELNKGS